MVEHLYTAEDVARRLGLHVRTVRGYVRDGRLKAARIGKQYRITREDLEAFVGSPLVDPSDGRRRRHVDVSSIVEIDTVDPETAHRISTLLMAAGAHRGDQQLRVQTAYDEERARMKVVVLGGLADTKQLLEYVRVVLES
jgi:excisionase family DNA binding protein